ncbi:MAG TPA: hypothetical protein VFE25_15050 [Opitutaceae bacterium]|jgi:hypothetical protein|nr:hypothetical protein [Opitutaceae bacterium]
MMADEESSSPPAAPSKVTLTEVKYSLPDLLAEIEAEKGSASFAMEKLDQAEIGKLFKTKKVVRVKPKT